MHNLLSRMPRLCGADDALPPALEAPRVGRGAWGVGGGGAAVPRPYAISSGNRRGGGVRTLILDDWTVAVP